MKVLVLGGTGAIGAHLVAILAANKENDIVVTSRRERQGTTNVKYATGDAHDTGFISALLVNGFDVIVDFMSYKTDEFRKRCSLYLNACQQYIFLSSARVYADNGAKPITEESPLLLDTINDRVYLRTDEYALTKARQEYILRQSKRKNYTIVRPYITYSENRLQLGVLEKEYWLYRALQGRSIVFSEDIANNMTTLTYGMDVSQTICALLGRQEALGEAFHITGENPIRWSDVLSLYRNVIAREKGFMPKVMMTQRSIRLRYPEAKWQVLYDRYFNRVFDNTKIKRFYNTNDFVTPQEGLDKCLTSFLHQPFFNALNWKEEACYDHICGEKMSTSENVNRQYMLYRYLPWLIVFDRVRQTVKMVLKG